MPMHLGLWRLFIGQLVEGIGIGNLDHPALRAPDNRIARPGGKIPVFLLVFVPDVLQLLVVCHLKLLKRYGRWLAPAVDNGGGGNKLADLHL